VGTRGKLNLLGFKNLEGFVISKIKKNHGLEWQRLQATCSSLFKTTERPSTLKERAIAIYFRKIVGCNAIAPLQM
jgi:hypothetical protein